MNDLIQIIKILSDEDLKIINKPKNLLFKRKYQLSS